MQRDTILWAFGILTYGVADVALTIYFVHTTPAVEAHPIIAAAIGMVGLWVLIPWKVAAIGVHYGTYRLAPKEWRIGVPIGLALLGSLITAWNLYLGLFQAHPL